MMSSASIFYFCISPSQGWFWNEGGSGVRHVGTYGYVFEDLQVSGVGVLRVGMRMAEDMEAYTRECEQVVVGT